MLTETQNQCLSLFQSGNFRELLVLFKEYPARFPLKQFPVGVFVTHGEPGDFGFRTANTTFAIPNAAPYAGSFITFTIAVLGEVTLNMHAPSADSVDWVNGTKDILWVHKKQLSVEEADKLARWAVERAKAA